MAHHRTPDAIGQPWVRTIGFDQLMELPSKLLEAWDVIEDETYLLAKDIAAERKQGDHG